MRVPGWILAFACLSCAAQSRPAILGISNMGVYSSDAAKAELFYVHQLGFKKAVDPYNAAGVRYSVNQEQFVEVLPLPADAGVNRLDHVGYITANAAQLLAYLKAKGVEAPAAVTHASDGSAWFEVKDPEGNTVQFVQPAAKLLAAKDTAPIYANPGADPIGHRIIHVGFAVHSQQKEDTFYRAILGFNPYWHGGMHPERTDWVSQQVPNGHDWLEYMLSVGANAAPSGREIAEAGASGSSALVSQGELGVLDHFSVGVVNMEKSVTQLSSEDRLGGADARPQMGKDGKWQFNLFDPDKVRVELMEFSAVEKPCCSGFTAANPTPTGQP
ncbi:MAG TPA: VOC family protein [Acidobacteriaceae bacterium]|jgi:catechol 2,3-dioxygenase-like lactoylglutathione lyase family enzyme|nr:VOC family protein [Acidobacteriaceae bacterium]